MEIDFNLKKKPVEHDSKEVVQKPESDRSCSSQLEVRSNYSTKSSKHQIAVKQPEETAKEKPKATPPKEPATKPPTGKPKKKEENLLSSIDDDVFDLLSNKE